MTSFVLKIVWNTPTVFRKDSSLVRNKKLLRTNNWCRILQLAVWSRTRPRDGKKKKSKMYWLVVVRVRPNKNRVKSNLVNYCKLGLENWKHWPWQNNSRYIRYAGPNNLRIRLDLAEISKKTLITIFWRVFGLQICVKFPPKKLVVPDQGENWCRQSWRRKGRHCTEVWATHFKRFLYMKQDK